MRKLMILFAFMAFWMLAGAQTTISLTPDSTGTITGTATGKMHEYTSPVISGRYSFAVEVYVTTGGTHATDSTQVYVYGSMDGTNYFQITDMGTPWLLGTAKYSASRKCGYKKSSEGTGAVGWVWHPDTDLNYRYIKVTIEQFKAASVLTVNRCKLHVFK